MLRVTVVCASVCLDSQIQKLIQTSDYLQQEAIRESFGCCVNTDCGCCETGWVFLCNKEGKGWWFGFHNFPQTVAHCPLACVYFFYYYYCNYLSLLLWCDDYIFFFFLRQSSISLFMLIAIKMILLANKLCVFFVRLLIYSGFEFTSITEL